MNIYEGYFESLKMAQKKNFMLNQRTNLKNIQNYHYLVQKLREFFINKNFIEAPTQHNLTILSACENPFSVSLFEYNGNTWPLIQTGQMILEEILLVNPHLDGCFCISTSYRNEKNPIPGRHEKIFPMFEFESRGSMEDLKDLERELLEFLGFGSPIERNYEDLCKEYNGVSTLEDEHENRMWKEIGSCISLQNFPERTSPFYNMKRNESTGLFNKIDVILYGQETIGSAERSCDPEIMRDLFYTISDGKYANKLFELFGKDRVEKELEEFLSLNFFPRFGGGIGLTRLSRAYSFLMKENKKELELIKEI
jgi:aspartyl/asparaginyl-tRNA synthetase